MLLLTAMITVYLVGFARAAGLGMGLPKDEGRGMKDEVRRDDDRRAAAGDRGSAAAPCHQHPEPSALQLPSRPVDDRPQEVGRFALVD